MNDSSQSPPINPTLAILIGILAVSTSSILIRFAQQEANSLVIAAYRLGLATLVLTPFVIWKHGSEIKSLKRRDWGLATLSAAFLTLHFITWVSSLEYTTVASSVVLVQTTPLWVALAAPLVLREPVTKAVIVGLAVALAGSVIVGLSDSCAQSAGGLSCPPLAEFVRGEAFIGDLLALGGALGGAGYLLVGRDLRQRTSLVAYIYLVYGITAVALIIIALASGQQMAGYSAATYGWFVLLALVPQLLGHSTFNWALRYLPAAFVSLTLLGEPIGSTILAYFLLGETPTLLKLFGAILILAGIYTASRKPAESQESLPA